MADITSSNIETFRENFSGGTRPNRFKVSGSKVDDAPFLVKATSLPAATVGIIPVPYRGRILKIPGDRLYAEWAITIIDDAESGTDLRANFVIWSNEINKFKENTTPDPTGYTDEWTVTMLGQTDDKSIREVTLHNVWVVEVGVIDLTYDTADTLTEFSVTMAYDYWTDEDTPP